MSEGARLLDEVVELRSPSAAVEPSPAFAVIARIVGCDDDGRVLVECDGRAGPIPARTIIEIDRNSVAGGRPVLVVLTAAGEPIVVGLLRSPAPVEALVDGERVVIDGDDEVVLRCGESSITLRRNGRIVIRGKYVETRSSGVNRIKGSTVQIN